MIGFATLGLVNRAKVLLPDLLEDLSSTVAEARRSSVHSRFDFVLYLLGELGIRLVAVGDELHRKYGDRDRSFCIGGPSRK